MKKIGLILVAGLLSLQLISQENSVNQFQSESAKIEQQMKALGEEMKALGEKMKEEKDRFKNDEIEESTYKENMSIYQKEMEAMGKEMGRLGSDLGKQTRKESKSAQDINQSKLDKEMEKLDVEMEKLDEQMEKLDDEIEESIEEAFEREKKHSKQPDTTSITIKGTKILIIQNGDSLDISQQDEDYEDCDDCDEFLKGGDDITYWSGIDLGMLSWSPTSPGLDFGRGSFLEKSNNIELNQGKSYTIGLNIFEESYPIVGQYAKLITGLGLRFDTYGLKNNAILSTKKDSLFSTSLVAPNFKRNNLNATYIHAPLMLALSTSKYQDKGVKVAAGVEFGYRIGGNQKTKYFQSGKKFKDKTKDDFQMNQFIASAVARVSLGQFTAFASSSLIPLFEADNVRDTYPFTVGLRIIPFDD